MWYVYILLSKKDNNIYIGLTNDLKCRIKTHNDRKVASTQFRIPFELLYYEAHHNKYDAAKREKFLQTCWGRNWIKKTLQNHLDSKRPKS